MAPRRDPVQRRDDGGRPRGVVDWRPDAPVNRVLCRLYALALAVSRGALVAAGVAILAALVLVGSLDAIGDPVVAGFVALSAVPALGLAAYVRYADVTTSEPLGLLGVTFALGFVFAGFAGVTNQVLADPLSVTLSEVGLDATLVTAVVFLGVVAPIEEGVKLLAVRVYAYHRPEFDAVVVGAVYGAAAGLGFATIENALYITQVADGAGTLGDTLARSGSIATQRALAGPGHVIYSAFAGYYLGLAKFNREYAGPIVLKGLLVASLIHGLYNVAVSTVPEPLAGVMGVSEFAAVFTVVIAYDGIFALLLARKLSLYRAAHQRVYGDGEPIRSERTEFE